LHTPSSKALLKNLKITVVSPIAQISSLGILFIDPLGEIWIRALTNVTMFLFLRAEKYGPVYRLNSFHYVVIMVYCPEATKVNISHLTSL